MQVPCPVRALLLPKAMGTPRKRAIYFLPGRKLHEQILHMLLPPDAPISSASGVEALLILRCDILMERLTPCPKSYRRILFFSITVFAFRPQINVTLISLECLNHIKSCLKDLSKVNSKTVAPAFHDNQG